MQKMLALFLAIWGVKVVYLRLTVIWQAVAETLLETRDYHDEKYIGP